MSAKKRGGKGSLRGPGKSAGNPAREEGTFFLGNVLKEYMKRLKKVALKKSLAVSEAMEEVLGKEYAFNMGEKELYIYVPDNTSSFRVTMKRENLLSVLKKKGLRIERVVVVKNPSAYREHPSDILRRIKKRMLEKSYGSRI